MGMQFKTFKAEVKEFNDQELTVTHFISTEESDRSGDIMRADGMVMRGVPAVLKEHGFDMAQGREPIAKPLSLTMGTDARGFKGILVKTQYYNGENLTPPDNTGRRLYEKAKGGYMDKWSVGFIVLEATPKSGGGRDVKRWEILEYSQVGVPDNMGATSAKGENEKGEYSLEVKMLEATAGAESTGQPATEKPAETQVFLKSIAERVATQIPHQALSSIVDAFFYELYNCEDDRELNALLKEFTDMAKPYCMAMIDAMNSYREKHSPEELAEHKSKILICVKTASDSEPAELPATETVPGGEVAPAQAAAVESAGSADAGEDSGLEFDETVTSQAQAAETPTEESVDLPVDAEGLAKMVSDATSQTFKQQIGKLTGKIQ